MNGYVYGLISVLFVNLASWIFYYGKFVGAVKDSLSRQHSNPCNDLKDLKNRIDNRLEVLVMEITEIRERVARIEALLNRRKEK